MHFVIVTPYFPSGADPSASPFIHRQALALAGRGHRVDVIHLQPRPPLLRRWSAHWRERPPLPGHERYEGIDVYRAPYLSSTQRPALRRLQGMAIEYAVREVLERHAELAAADVLYAQWLVPYGYGCLRAARHAGIPCLAIARGADLNLWASVPALRRQLVHVIDEADGLLGNGAWVTSALERAAGKPIERPVDVVYNPCDLSAFLAVERDDPVLRRTARQTLGLPEDVPLVVFLGQLDVRKGPDTLLDAVARLGGEWHLAMAGGGPLAATLADQAARLGLGARVRFFGPIAPALAPTLMAAGDVLALPSRREGLPNVLVEALATAMPAVATPVGGSAEVVIDGRTGWLVPPAEPAALADAIVDAHTRPDEARTRGRAGRMLVRELFDLERNLDRLEAVARWVARAPAAPAHLRRSA